MYIFVYFKLLQARCISSIPQLPSQQQKTQCSGTQMAYWERACFQLDLLPAGLGRLHVEVLGYPLTATPGLLIVRTACESPDPALCDLASPILSANESGFMQAAASISKWKQQCCCDCAAQLLGCGTVNQLWGIQGRSICRQANPQSEYVAQDNRADRVCHLPSKKLSTSTTEISAVCAGCQGAECSNRPCWPCSPCPTQGSPHPAHGPFQPPELPVPAPVTLQ